MERRLGSGGDVGRSFEWGERRPCRSMRCGKGVCRSILESESRASSSSTSTSNWRGWGKCFEDPEDLYPLRLFALERDLVSVTFGAREREWLETRERGRERGRGVAWIMADTSGLVERGLSVVGKEMASSEARLNLRGVLSLMVEGGEGNEARVS